MIDHISHAVSDSTRARAFYTAALAPLGYTVLMDFGEVYGMGIAPKPDFWLMPAKGTVLPAHVAFQAPNRAAVDDFHRAALAAGGRDNGEPGLRPQYHPSYYGAFVLDADGHNIEAVCHKPE